LFNKIKSVKASIIITFIVFVIMPEVISGYDTAAPELVDSISSVYTSEGFKSNALNSRFTRDSPVLCPNFRQDRRGT
jgi:hypothetical protein